MKTAAITLLFLLVSPVLASGPVEPEWLKPGGDYAKIRAALLKAHDDKQDVTTPLALAYEASKDPTQKAWIAQLLYGLGIPSAEAKRVLMKDVKTQDRNLRLQVQWALGRVSGDDDVVAVLLENMLSDGNALFRDKAACALASDQIHLSPKQKVKLYDGVIRGLASSEPQVRSISIQVLKIQTGQDKGYNPGAGEPERQTKIEEWRKWLKEYESNL
ncbi:MAG TPA: HEAT repeat domain-containing protein [Bdellovibrionota bacterium]|nr:HEAT repeat domain-containing protein [Bdellovibrionota bacterium]